jgi:Ca2+-binding RTX toxin-like protein
VLASFEGMFDGDDYIEGNGGNDVIFGNLGQDDIVGGSSNLFGLNTAQKRPDGSDLVFGGAGTDIQRNDFGDATVGTNGVVSVNAGGHARDADTLIGDNGLILRLVGVNGTQRGLGDVVGNVANAATTAGVSSTGGFLNFNYDNQALGSGAGNHRIIVARGRLPRLPRGRHRLHRGAANDIGAADELHGESGDDVIYGMKGNDILFGEGQDDDLIGGHGNDWISGGTGDDGVIGDDGRIMTSRNATGYGEP